MSEVLLSVGWIIILCLIWTLFVFATSMAWNMGQMFVNFRIGLQFHKWMLEAKAIHDKSHKDWQIENPNEVKDDSAPKKRKR